MKPILKALLVNMYNGYSDGAFTVIAHTYANEGSATVCLGVRDFEIHWISRGFRISDWISGFHVDFWISKWISGFHVDFWISHGFPDFKVDFYILDFV